MEWSDRIRCYFRSLTGRIVLGGLMIHAILIPLLYVGVVVIIQSGFKARFVDQVRANAYVFATLIERTQEPGNIRLVLADAMLSGQLVYAELIDEKNSANNHQFRLKSGTFVEDFFFGEHGDGVYYIAVPLGNEYEIQRTLRIGFDEEPVLAQINRTSTLFTFLTLGYVLLIISLSSIFGPLISKPLRKLREYAKVVASGNYERELSVRSDISEVGGLSDELEMMRRELVRHNRELEYQSLHDALTALPNRVLLQDRLHQAILAAQRENARLALLLIDLDGFKEVNDAHGHQCGDLLLKQVAARLHSVLQDSDTIARLGGDEFAVLLPSVKDPDAVVACARRLIATLDQPVFVEDRPFNLSLSIGIAMYPDHGADESTILRHADVAMYVAKRNQIDYCVYDPTQNSNNITRLSLMWDLRQALGQEEFLLHYQPIIDLRRNTLTSVEAALRWQHPRRGLLLPGEFLSLAEQAGLSDSICLWVVNEALRQCSLWWTGGYEFKVAVNLSTRNLYDDKLLKGICDLLEAWQVAPKLLTIEITENALITDPAIALKNLLFISDRGIALSIDDFGTGYSSLSYLNKLPLGEIKIDASYVNNMLHSESDLAVVRSTIALAHNMACQAVAEGVETEEVLKAVSAMGCDKAQGFYICKPMSAAYLKHWLNRSRWSGYDRDIAAHE